VPRGNRTGCAGAEPTEVIGLDQGEQLGPVRSEEGDDEARAFGEAHVCLHARPAKLEVGGSHHVQAPVLQPEPKPRPILDRSAGEAPEAGLDDLDGLGRAEELLDVGFAQEERHGGGIV
jgi:hypothetical protein